MNLPIEVLDRVVTSGLDSFESLMAWSQIGVHFRSVVRKKLGILAIIDSDKHASRASPAPLNYDLVSDESNTMCVFSDTFDFGNVSEFLGRFDNILVVVMSDRFYSDPLATTLGELSKGLSGMGQEKNICLIYKTYVNFLSKFYFRELCHCSALLRLCELHILANSSGAFDREEVDMFDVDTIFENTYLHNVEIVYTLNLRRGRKVMAPKLRTLKHLQVEDNSGIVESLKYCPLLSNIDQYQLPPGRTVILPPCDHLVIANYNTNVVRDLVDGSHVRESLTIKPSLLSSEPKFMNIKCPSIVSLYLEFNTNILGNVKFIDCFFGNLKSYKAPISTDWEDLVYSKSVYIDTIGFTVSSILSLQNLCEIPFSLNKLILYSSDVELQVTELQPVQLETVSSYKQIIQDLKRIEFHLHNIWDCVVFQHNILPFLVEDTELFVEIDRYSIANEILKARMKDSTLSQLAILQLNWNQSKLVFRIPKLKAFQIYSNAQQQQFHESRGRSSSMNGDTLSLLHPLVHTTENAFANRSQIDIIDFIDMNT